MQFATDVRHSRGTAHELFYGFSTIMISDDVVVMKGCRKSQKVRLGIFSHFLGSQAAPGIFF